MFKLAPKLSEGVLLLTHFLYNYISTSTNVVNHSVGSALKFLAKEVDKPEYLITN